VLPLARRLKTHGHAVLVAARDLSLAARVLGPAGIPFVQAPRLTAVHKPERQPASYADLLFYQGWNEASHLWGAVQGWVNLMRLFQADAVVFDHSPTALLAARGTAIARGLLGTGFEVPPLLAPIPVFPGIPGLRPEAAESNESAVLENANRVLAALHVPPLEALRDLFQVERLWLTTFPELDHYGVRPGQPYFGTMGELDAGQRLEWPSGQGPRVFAYLRSTTPNLTRLLGSLQSSNAAIICWAPEVAAASMAALRSARAIIASQPVDLAHLLPTADLCVSYAPAGTVTYSLLHGVPQLMAPAHVEAQLTAYRVAKMGAGCVLGGSEDEEGISIALRRLLVESGFASQARRFAERYRGHDAGKTADAMVRDIENLTRGRCN
jgi:UDP:flavonoid glycosyltransferase YjiC (YdhE family)